MHLGAEPRACGSEREEYEFSAYVGENPRPPRVRIALVGVVLHAKLRAVKPGGRGELESKQAGSPQGGREETSAPSSARVQVALPAPDVTFTEELATYDTLSAIAQELRPGPRAPMPTNRYGDRLSNAPGATSPRSARQLDHAPALDVRETALGRDTMAAIQEELAPHTAAPEISVGEEIAGQDTLVAIRQELGPASLFDADAYEIHEMVTFVVRGDASSLSGPGARRELVERRLLSRLPVRSMNEVEHIDVAPWTTRGTMIVRVWCRV